MFAMSIRPTVSLASSAMKSKKCHLWVFDIHLLNVAKITYFPLHYWVYHFQAQTHSSSYVCISVMSLRLTSLIVHEQLNDLGGGPPLFSITHFYMDYYSLADPVGTED